MEIRKPNDKLKMKKPPKSDIEIAIERLEKKVDKLLTLIKKVEKD